jgi:hypothetical protein
VKITLVRVKITLIRVKNTLVRVKITLMRVDITLERVKITLMRVDITLVRVKITLGVCSEKLSVLEKIFLKIDTRTCHFYTFACRIRVGFCVSNRHAIFYCALSSDHFILFSLSITINF